MRLLTMTWLLCACVWLARGDVAHLKAGKARLLGKLAGRGRHHKRGLLSAVPPFKLGHDIPHVHHSVVKPLVVTYPPTAVPVSVKVPLHNPLVHRYPVSTGHGLPHHHHGPKFPHLHKTFAKPDQHFHHHHHHVSPRPLVPVVPTSPVLPAPPTAVVPVAQPSIPVARPVPAPPPVFFHRPAPLVPAQPLPVSPPPVNILPPHLHLRPTFPAFQPVSAVPLAPHAPQYNYVIRPGNAVQTSFFATYPRYPVVNYETPIVPAPQPAPVNQVYLENHNQVPHFHLIPQLQHVAHGAVVEPLPSVSVQATPTLLHPTQLEPHPPAVLQPTQPAVHLDHDGWSPLQPHSVHDLTAAQHFFQEQNHQLAHEQANHFIQEQNHLAHDQAHHYIQEQNHLAHDQAHHFIQEQNHQLAHDQANHFIQEQNHLAHDQAHHFIQEQNHLTHGQADHFIQGQNHQLAHDQAQHFIQEQNNLAHDQANHFIQDQNHQLAHDQAHFIAQNQGAQVYEGHTGDDQQYHELQHQLQQHVQHHLNEQEYGPPHEQQPGVEYGEPQQQYGSPQPGIEGRSSEGDGEEQKISNPFPETQQLPLDRPLEHFR